MSMNEILNQVFTTQQYKSEADRLRATFLYSITVLAIFGLLFLIYLIPRNGTFNIIDAAQNGRLWSQLWWAHLMIIISLVSYGFVRIGKMDIADWILPFGFYLIHIIASWANGFVSPLDYLLPVLLMLGSGLLLKPRDFFVAVAIYISLYTVMIISRANVDYPNELQYIGGLIIFAIVIYTFQRVALVSRIEGQNLEGAERFKLADINMQITQQASERQSLEVAMNATLNLILKNYPSLYHAQVFLIDEEGIQARLSASTGDVGQRLLEKGHSLAVGSLSVIGQTTLKGDVLVARAGTEDGIHRQNQLLPETTLEAAFPLLVAGQIIGALDLQSKTLSDLSESDRLTFQSLANSLALTIDSIQQFEAAKARIAENQRLAEQTRTALRDVERLNQRLIGRAWSEYLSGQGSNLGLTVNFENNSVTEDVAWTDTLLSSVEINNLVKEGTVIAIPLTVRGQIIGAMEFELAENEEFSPEDLELIQEVSNRFGLAAENTRLVEESQRTAQRETLINEITSRFQSAQNVEATLAEAARSLNDALGAERIIIRLGSPQETANGS